ncbi:MAG: hypothetical protein EOP52_08730 [Sphingobacteriales bacterium]|nr:MAG: hypothetical protein EOP52_08730 [Sphingobacteriales bacterium]
MPVTNQCLVKADPKAVYITVLSGMTTAAKYGFGAFSLIVTILRLVLIQSLLSDSVRFFIPALLVFGFFIGLPWLLWSWNAFGKEQISISTRFIVSQKDYGFFRTAPKAHPIRKGELSQETTVARSIYGVEFLNVAWYTSHAITDVPVLVYAQTLAIAAADADRIRTQVEALFSTAQNLPITFSAN